VQILVRVANTQERTLWAEVEKGFARTAFGRESVGPKESAKAVGPGRWRSNTQVAPPTKRESGQLSGTKTWRARRRRVRTQRRLRLPWEEFSFLLNRFDVPGIELIGDRVRDLAEPSAFWEVRCVAVGP